MLKASGIFKSYGTLDILKGIDLEVSKAEIVSIVGASGAGKSTLLHILGTLDTPDKGELEINSRKITGLNSSKMSEFRNLHIGFIFQFHHLLPEFNAIENACMPSLIAGKSMKESFKKAEELFSLLNISHRKDHKPGELSGGEQQRVAIARALINEPDLILADEPSGNLDSANAKEMNSLFLRLRKELQQTFIMVTHNEELANIADRKLTMRDGKFI